MLHEGPVPGDLDAEQLRAVRARFLADSGWGIFDRILADLSERDRELLSAAEVTLWFEHDLYDQLQLIQILSMLPCRSVWIIQADVYLGCMDIERLASLRATRTLVSQAQFRLAADAWQAFRSPTTDSLRRIVGSPCEELPHLRATLIRHLEDFPSDVDGLTRTERQIIRAVNDGADTFAKIFHSTQAMESAIYIGDSVFAIHLARLAPLVGAAEPYHLDPAGSLPSIERWLGGVHLTA